MIYTRAFALSSFPLHLLPNKPKQLETSFSSERTWTNLPTDWVAPQQTDGSSIPIHITLAHSFVSSLTGVHQAGGCDDGERDAVVPHAQSHCWYSSLIFLSIPLPRRNQCHEPAGSHSDGALGGRAPQRARVAVFGCVCLTERVKLRVCFTKRFLSVTRAHFPSPSLSPYEYDGSAVFSRLFYIVNIFEKLASGAGPVCLSDQLQRAGPGRGGSGLHEWGLGLKNIG